MTIWTLIISSPITYFMGLFMCYNSNMKNEHKNIDTNETDWQIIPTEPELQHVREWLQIVTEFSANTRQPEKPVIIY